MNALVAQALIRLAHHVDKSVPQPADVITRDVEFLMFRCGLATGVRPAVDVAAVVDALVAL